MLSLSSEMTEIGRHYWMPLAHSPSLSLAFSLFYSDETNIEVLRLNAHCEIDSVAVSAADNDSRANVNLYMLESFQWKLTQKPINVNEYMSEMAFHTHTHPHSFGSQVQHPTKWLFHQFTTVRCHFTEKGPPLTNQIETKIIAYRIQKQKCFIQICQNEFNGDCVLNRPHLPILEILAKMRKNYRLPNVIFASVQRVHRKSMLAHKQKSSWAVLSHQAQSCIWFISVSVCEKESNFDMLSTNWSLQTFLKKISMFESMFSDNRT